MIAIKIKQKGSKVKISSITNKGELDNVVSRLNNIDYQGHVETPYWRLKEVFGMPNVLVDDKLDRVAAWIIKTPNGIVRITDSPSTEPEKQVIDITEWHLYGEKQDVLIWVDYFLNSRFYAK